MQHKELPQGDVVIIDQQLKADESTDMLRLVLTCLKSKCQNSWGRIFSKHNSDSSEVAESKLQIIWITVFAIILCLPAINMQFHLVRDLQLNGLALPSRVPKLNWKSFVDESFQKRVESWVMKRNGLWGWLVGTNNQIHFSVFNQASSNYGSQVIKGLDGQLFQPMYLKSFNRTGEVPMDLLKEKVRLLKELQERLDERGIKLLVLISTNVISLYPDLVPPRYLNTKRLEKQNSYQVMRPMLDEAGIRYLDANEMLMGIKDNYPFRFFSRSGSHWNDVASCIVTDKLLERVQQLIGKDIARPNCSQYELQPEPQASDLDLLQVANLLFTKKFFEPTPYVVSHTGDNAEKYKPKMLFIGTSFLFSVVNWIEKEQLASEYPLFFYFRQFRNNRADPFHTLNRERIRWKERVLSKDVIVLEINTNNIGLVGFGFATSALKQLRPTSP